VDGKTQGIQLNANMKYKEQVNTETGEKRWVLDEGAEQPQQNILEKIGGFLSPIASKTSQIIGGTLGLKSRASQEAEESQRKAEEMNRMLIGRAQTALPEQKEDLLGASRSISQNLGQVSQERLAGAQQAVPIDTETFSPVKQGVGTALELGALLAPGIGAKGLQVTKGTSILKSLAGAGIKKAVTRGAVTGASTAGLTALAHTLSEDENIEAGRVITSGILGGLTGGAIAGSFALGSKMFKKLTEWLPVVQRRIGTKIPVGEYRNALADANEMAKETLTKGKYGTMAEEISEGKFKGTPPGTYKGLKKWLVDMFGVADDELSKQTVNTVFSIDDIAQGEQQEVVKKNLQSFLDGIKIRLEFEGGRGKDVVFKADKYKPTIDALLAGEQIPFADLNMLRRAIDASRRATHKAMQKSGATLVEKSGDKAVSIMNTSNLIRDALRYKSPEDVAKLFDMQSFALSFIDRFDRSIASYERRLIPSRWEMTILAGAGFAGGAPLAGAAGIGTAAYRAPQIPGVQKFLYGLGQKAQKVAPAVTGLEQLLRKGTAVGAGRM